MRIRLALMSEVSALEALIAASVRALSVNYYSSEQIESALVHVFGVDTQLIVDGTYFVAELGGQIVGCGGWSKRKTLFGGDQTKSGEDNLLDPSTDAARIRAFFIHPDFARRGIGKQLIESCETAAKNAGFRRLEMGATLPGEPMYQAVGYEVLERFDLPFSNGVTLPLVRMGKAII